MSDEGGKDLETIKDGDVVILPAFGASLEEMKTLDDKNVQVVDTTCPWVSKVWNTVDKHTKKQFTSVIHGKWAHEETVATASFCDKYLVVKSMAEAEYVAAYIANGGGDKAEFMEKFKNAMSAGFDPDVDLVKVGLANQTTMYKRETRDIGKLFEKTLMEKYGPAEVGEHWMAFDTICDATQERQVREEGGWGSGVNLTLVAGLCWRSQIARGGACVFLLWCTVLLLLLMLLCVFLVVLRRSVTCSCLHLCVDPCVTAKDKTPVKLSFRHSPVALRTCIGTVC